MATNKIAIRKDTAANWTSNNPTLLAGEQGYETDTGLRKVGDGSTAWTSLDYATDTGAGNKNITTAASYNGSVPAGNIMTGLMIGAGALVSWGSNANGRYWRWESGLQICSTPGIVAVTGITMAAQGNIYEQNANQSWTLPITFSTILHADVFAGEISASPKWSRLVTFSTSTVSFRVMAAASGVTAYNYSGFAIGLWK